MSRRVAIASVGLGIAFLTIAWSVTAHAQVSPKELQATEARRFGLSCEKIMRALDGPTEMDFVETPLKDVVEALKVRHGIEIQLDAKAITDAGGSVDMPITRQVKGISLRSALRMMLREHDLDFAISDEVLVITSSEGRLALRQYEVGDLVSDDAPIGALVEAVRFALPRKAAESNEAPQPSAGGGGSLGPVGGTASAGNRTDPNAIDGEVMSFGTVLFVRTSDRGHMDVNTMLAEMRHRRHIAESGDAAPTSEVPAPMQPAPKPRHLDRPTPHSESPTPAAKPSDR
jgi:hypothetical protein